MAKEKIRISIALLIGFCLFAILLKLIPVSISFGERHDLRADSVNDFLQPGRVYFVCVDKPMNPPEGMKPIPNGFLGTGFFHDGKRDDNPKRMCWGDITILLDDDGYMNYRCERCKKVWDNTHDTKKGELP